MWNLVRIWKTEQPINGVDKTSVHTYYFKFTSQSQPLQYTGRYPTVCHQAILITSNNKQAHINKRSKNYHFFLTEHNCTSSKMESLHVSGSNCEFLYLNFLYIFLKSKHTHIPTYCWYKKCTFLFNLANIASFTFFFFFLFCTHPNDVYCTTCFNPPFIFLTLKKSVWLYGIW